MESLNEYIKAYKEQIKKGDIKKAYRGIIQYMSDLKIYLQNKYPDYVVSSNLYFGYMDMTYFAFTPKCIREKKLKFAIVFQHDTCSFEIWLAGNNKTVLDKYRKKLKNDISQFEVSEEPSDSIIEHVLVKDPDFDNPKVLMNQMDKAVLNFIQDVKGFL